MNKYYIYNGKLYTEAQLQEAYGDQWEAKAAEKGIELAYEYNDTVYSESQLKEAYGDNYQTVAQEKGVTLYGQKKNIIENQAQEDMASASGAGSSDYADNEAIQQRIADARRAAINTSDADLQEFMQNDPELQALMAEDKASKAAKSVLGQDIRPIEEWKAQQDQGLSSEYKSDVFFSGLNRLNEAITSIPESVYDISALVYDIAALPQNALASALDLPEDHWLRVSSLMSAEELKKELGVKNLAYDYYKKEGKKIQQNIQKYKTERYGEDTDIWDNIENGNYKAAGELLAAGVVESAPLSLGIMASGSLVGFGATAAGTTVALTTPQRDALKEKYPNLSNTQLTSMAVSMAAAESVFESIGGATIAALYKGILKKEGAQVGRKVFRETLIDMYQGALKKYGLVIGGVVEGLEEFGTQVTQNMIEGRPIFEGASDAFLIGMASGVAMSAPAQVYQSTKKTQESIQEQEQAQQPTEQAQPVPEGATQPLEQPTEQAQPSYSINGNELTRDEFVSEINSMSTEEAGKASIVVNNDQEVSNIVDRKMAPETVSEPTPEKVSDLIDRPVVVTELGGSKLDTPIEGSLYQEGQQVVVEDADGNITELGNIDEISDKTLQEMGIQPEVSDIKVTNKGNLQVGEDILVPDKTGIKKDKKGNVNRVVLRTEDGAKTVTLRGRNAEEAAYQILLKEATSPEQEQRINDLLENDEQFQNELREATTATEAQAATDTQQVTERRQAEEYSTRLNRAIESNPDQYWSVDPVTPEQAMKSTVVMSEDGGLIVTEDGDMKGLFKDPNSTAKGVAADLLRRGVEAGGRKGDNFDGYLTEIYKKNGFRVTGRVPFNEEYAPKGWNKAKHGTPDVVAIVYDPQNKLDVTEKTFDSYDDMIADRDSYLQEQPSVEQEVSKLEQLLKPNVAKQVENAKRALSRIAPNIEIIVAKSDADYRRLTNEQSRNQSTAGTYSNGKIYINPAKASATTVAHEVFHAILLSKGRTNAEAKAITDRMMAAVRKNASADLIAQLDEFASQYDSALQSEESIAELFGLLANNYATLSTANKNVIKRWLDKLAKVLGLKPFTDAEVIDLLNTVSGKVAAGVEITEADIKLFEGGKNVKNPIQGIQRKQVGEFDVVYTEQERLQELIDQGLVVEVKNNKELSGLFTAITSPDDMIAGTISIDGNVIFEGGGGIYFVTKYGDVWAAGDKNGAQRFANAINNSLIKNKGKGLLVLAKGSDSKLISSPSGVDSSLSIIEVMLDRGLISASDLRNAVSSSVKRAGGIIKLTGNTKSLITEINKYFSDPSTTTFEDRGNVIKDLIGQLAQTASVKSNQNEIIKLLGGDPNKALGKKKGKTQQGLSDLIAGVASEQITKGLNVGDIYAVIEVSSEVEVVKDSHPSYPYHIRTKDASKPILKLLTTRENGSNLLTLNNGNPYTVGNISILSGKFNENIASPIESVSERTQGFFGDVVSGKLDKYKPSSPYKYEMLFNKDQSIFKNAFDKYKGNFDEHIATSIPTFRDIQVKKGNAIIQTISEGLMYDLGGSEGGFVKTITEQSKGKIKTINVEPQVDMANSHEATPVEGSKVVREAFQQGWDDVKTYKPTKKGDVVHESMLFQFISPERASKIKEVKDNYLKEDGLFITEQKFSQTDKTKQKQYENIKDKFHKSKYYTKDQINAKAESVLVGMSENQANIDSYINELKSEFKYVKTYWKAGNFQGIVASNDKAKVDNFIENLGDTSNRYNDTTRKQLAPNGKPSNLTKEQYEAVRTPEFKKWFGDWENNPENASKIVDENGEPLVLYHGSPAVDIDQFDRQKSIRISSGLKEFGTYFSTNKNLANIYSKVDRSKEYEESIIKTIFDLENKLKQTRSPKEYNEIQNYINELRQKGKIYPVFINLRNVEEFDAKGKDFKGWSELKVDASYKTATDRDAMEFLMDGKFGVEKKQGVVAKNIADGIFNSKEAINQHMGDVVLVFDNQSNAVKLADGTNKTFNANDPSIRKQSQSINTIINVAKQNNISDQAIKQYLLSQGFTQQQIDDAFNKIPKSIKESQLSKIGESSRQKMKTKGVPLMKRLNDRYNRFIEEALDRQALPKRIMRKAGLANTPTFMVANAGASSHAKRLAEKAYDRTVAGLSNKMITRLEEIIFARRVKAIDTNRAERAADAKDKFDKISDEYNELKKKRIKDRTQEDIDKINEYKKLEDRYNRLKDPIIHPKKYTSEQADIDLEVYRKELGDKDFNDLMKRADNYFDEYRSLLNTMREEGLIDNDVYEMFAEVDYQPRQFLNHITDINGDLLYDEMYSVQTQSLADKQIQSLQKGSDQDLYMDAFNILESSILSRAHAVFSNRMNKTFAKEYSNRLEEINKLKEKQNPTKNELKEIADFEALQENILMDEIVDYTSTGKPKYKLSDAKTIGYKPVYYYENGVKNRIWMKKPFFDKYTDTNNQYLSSVARENIALASGTAAVKTLATGKNPLFFLTNTPRDFMFILAFSPEYSNNVAKSAFQLMRDASKGVKDVVKGTALYDKYIEYGGGMDFLALQGKYKNKGILKSMVDATFDKKTQDRIGKNPISKFLDKFNLASEVGFRMAVFNKSINNQLKELGETDINKLSKEQQDLIYTNAVKQARQLTDFNQGGRAVKALDAGLPYLNAAVQGTRAAVSNLKQRPLETTSRIMQITAYSAATVIGSSIAAIAAFRDDDDEEIKNKKTSEIYFETISAVSQYDLDNYFIIPLGIKDDRGNWKYLRIAKSQALTPYLNASEHYIRKAIADQSGIEYKQDLGETMMRTFETNISPLPLSLKQSAGRIPLFDATMALYGFDSYTGNPLSWDMGKIPEQLEGIVDDRVEPAYKELGKVAGQSPVRLQSAVESFITTPSTNPYIGLTYGLANTAVSLGDTESIVSDLKNIGTQSMKRLIKSTSEYNEVAKAKERMSDEIIDVYRKHIEVEADVRKAVKTAKETGDTEKALEKLNSIYKENPEMLDNIRKWYKSEVGKKRLLPLVSSLRFQEIKEVKAIILADYFGKKLMKSDPDFTEREQKVWDQLKEEKVIDKEVVQFYVNMFQKK